jgi:phage terminase large subunit
MAEVRRIIIPYAPRKVFLPFHNRAQRFAVGVAHRRCGKTVATINDKIKRAVTNTKPMYRAAYIAPYLGQAKDAAWEYLKKYAGPVLTRPPNQSELWVEVMSPGGPARIRIYGADNADALRGGYFDDATLDEYADMAPGIWGSVIRPMLADRQGSATFIGTPKGRNAFYDIYTRAKSDPDWATFFLPASQTGILPESELQAARLDMTPEQYAQEFECSFEAAIIGAYFGKEIAEAEREGRITSVEYDDSLPVHTAWDLGMGDSTAIWFFQVATNQIRVIDHYENHGQPIAHYVAELASRKYQYGDDWVPHDARVRELGTGRTRLETLISLGRKPRVVPAHKIDDGINAARVSFGLCWFDEARCASGLESLRQYRADYDEKARTFKNKPKHDWTSHTSDAFRYLCMAWREIEPPPAGPAPLKGLRDVTLDDLWDMQPRRMGSGRI